MTITDVTKEDVINSLKIYDLIKERAEDLIVNSWCRDRANIERVSLCDDENLTIYFNYYCCGEIDWDEDTVPLSWLFLNDDELAEERIKESERRREAEKKAEEEHKAWLGKEQKRKERKQYEKLKAKYGE